ncbi:hypothetical protein ACIPRL_37695 [Streptomyces sp. NPDC090085]|uniref:hypothetical protein n=1 Tax=Streptomyces sp. NPDC090085 TaxID=3365943 RepID=UPI003829550A
MPTALPSDRIACLPDRLGDLRDRLMVALVAIYTFLPGQLAHLRRTDIALGRPARLTPARRHHATVRFLTSPAVGRLTAVTGLPRPGPGTPLVRLRARPGDPVGPAHTNAGRLGSLIVVSPDARTTAARAAQLLDDIRIEVEPHPA